MAGWIIRRTPVVARPRRVERKDISGVLYIKEGSVGDPHRRMRELITVCIETAFFKSMSKKKTIPASNGHSWLTQPASRLDGPSQAKQRTLIEEPADERDAVGAARGLEVDWNRQ